MVAPAIQTAGATDMAHCKLCMPCLRQIGIRLADPSQTFVACIPFAPTVATGYADMRICGYAVAATGFRKLRCAAGRHLGTGIRTSNSEEYADRKHRSQDPAACSAVISTTAFDVCIAVITTNGSRSCIAVITAAWLLEMPL